MNIPPIKPENTVQFSKPRPKQPKAEAAALQAAQDSIKTDHNLDSLLDAMRNDPDVRAEMVEYGKRLAADSNYPPPEMFPKLAELVLKGSLK